IADIQHAVAVEVGGVVVGLVIDLVVLTHHQHVERWHGITHVQWGLGRHRRVAGEKHRVGFHGDRRHHCDSRYRAHGTEPDLGPAIHALTPVDAIHGMNTVSTTASELWNTARSFANAVIW